VLFLRSQGGDDPGTCLWVLDVGTGEERLVADPRQLLGSASEELPPEEAARRERVREQAAGVVGYATDRAGDTVAVALSGRLWVAEVGSGVVRELVVPGPVVDPRPDPTGARVAYVRGGTLRVVDADGGGDVALAEPDGPEVTYGLAEFVAAEEMGRTEGYWWSPTGDAVLVARVDTAPVARWYIADPANPDRPPREVAYPAAGTANADVSLWIVALDGTKIPVPWDRARFEYLVAAHWDEAGLLVVVESRDQRRLRVLDVDPVTGATTTRREDTDRYWLDIVHGVPAVTASGKLVWTVDADDTHRLVVGDQVATPPGLQVRSVADVDGEVVLFTASEEPTEIQLWEASPAGVERLTTAPGVHAGRRAGGTTVVVSRSLDRDGVRVTVHRQGDVVASIGSRAETPVVTPRPQLRSLGQRQLRTAVLFPTDHQPGSRTLPVLLDPYGGPAAQRVLATRDAFLTSQWFADQGFAVVVIDGRGTPGRGPSWARSTWGDCAAPVLQDQVDGLAEAARVYPDLDLGRVAIRGWSFGGFLAALAVLRRPDVFHAAVAGAPVTDQRLYDTHYQERYLGHPAEEPDNYDRCSLIDDAPRLRRHLLLIHGLADDNVVVAHTLRLSAALVESGRPHAVLPLSGVTHMTPQETVAENRLRLELEFLRRSLGMPDPEALEA
jgi:dipeptidyl-peptidase-4